MYVAFILFYGQAVGKIIHRVHKFRGLISGTTCVEVHCSALRLKFEEVVSLHNAKFVPMVKRVIIHVNPEGPDLVRVNQGVIHHSTEVQGLVED